MNIKEKLKKFAKADDFDVPRVVRISTVEEVKVGGRFGDNRTVMWCDNWPDAIPLSLDALRTMAKMLKSYETNEWVGKSVVVFNDKNVKYTDQNTGEVKRGGIRVRDVTEADTARERDLPQYSGDAPSRTDDIPF